MGSLERRGEPWRLLGGYGGGSDRLRLCVPCPRRPRGKVNHYSESVVHISTYDRAAAEPGVRG